MKKINWLASLLVIVALLAQSVLAQAQTTEKKKMSPQAKGAIIGGVGGAAAGAIINKKNRVVGGAVGAAAGAGTGYVVGKVIDNKQKKKEAEAAAEAERVAAIERAAAAERAAAIARAEAANNRPVATTSTTRSTTTRSTATRGRSTRATTPVTAFAPPMAAPVATVDNQMALSAMYLPNDSYGMSTVEYPNSEYRRKSW